MTQIQLKRVKGDFGFEAGDADGHVLHIDGSPEIGGQGSGARPMHILLMALGGCSGIDIVSILKKQRQEVTGFNMRIEGERESGKDVSLWKTIHIVFELAGQIDPDKAKRACELSMNKYCSVAETLKRAGATITWEVSIN